MLKQKIPWKKAVADWGLVAIQLFFYLELSTETIQRVSFQEETKKKWRIKATDFTVFKLNFEFVLYIRIFFL